MDTDNRSSSTEVNQELIKMLIQQMRGMEHIEPIVTIEDNTSKNEKMAPIVNNVNNEPKPSYADILTGDSGTNNPNHSDNQSRSSESVKPIFLKDEDLFGSVKPEKSQWLTNVEIYKAIGMKVHPECIKGIQRVREMWRIYMDNEEDRLTLVTQGLSLRGRQITLHTQNPRNPQRFRPDTVRIRVKNIPLSADDGQIHRALTLEGCDIEGVFRERLRVDNKLTNCETGDRLVISKTLSQPLPRNMQIGKYWARIFHPGQINEENGNINISKVCHKCLQAGHFFYQCTNDWVCKTCKQSGHKMIDCPNDINFDTEMSGEEEIKESYNSKDEEDEITPTTEKTSSKKDSNTVNKHSKQSSTTESKQKSSESTPKETKDSGESKKVHIVENNQTQKDRSQKTIENFMKATRKGSSSIARTPPTPTDKLHDQQRINSSKGPKKAKYKQTNS